MKSQLQKASKDYTTVEGMLDVEDSCWNLFILLEKLKIVDRHWKPSAYVESESPPARDWVSNMYQLYMERKGS